MGGVEAISMGSTKEQRERRLNIWLRLFNISYPRWEINGDASATLTADDVVYRSLSSNWGKCGVRKDGRIYFGLNHSWWDDSDVSARLGLCLHELAHVKQHNHRPAFWELVVRLYQRVSDHADDVEELFGELINWRQVKEWLIGDVRTRNVDNRTEIAYDRRIKMAEGLDYPVDEIGAFDGVIVRWKRNYKDSRMGVSFSDVECPRYEFEEVHDWFTSPQRRDGVESDGTRYIVDYPVVERTNIHSGDATECRVIDGEWRLNFHRFIRDDDLLFVECPDG